MLSFIYPITATIRTFLERCQQRRETTPAEDVEKMHGAWFKSVVMQVTLWSQPYAREGDF